MEGEIGCLCWKPAGWEEDGVGRRRHCWIHQLLTDPEEAAVSSDTGVDAWPSPSAPRMALTNSPVRPRATSWPSTASRKSTPHPQYPSGDARPPARSPRTGWRSSADHGGDIKETYGVPVEQIVEADQGTACARSTSTPTCVWPRPAQSGRFLAQNRASSTAQISETICNARYLHCPLPNLRCRQRPADHTGFTGKMADQYWGG